MKRLFIQLFFLQILCSVLFAQEIVNPDDITNDPYARFIPFDSYLGKDYGQIIDIDQDHIGYIWLGGTKGLFRFDGNTARKYVNDWTPGSLPSSAVNCILPDTYKRLLIGTSNGLCQYNYENDRFTPIIGPLQQPGNADTFHVRALLADGDSLLWMETLQGYLWKIDLHALQVIEQYKHEPVSQPYYYYHDIIRDHENTIWVGGRNIGPLYLDDREGKLIYISSTSGIPIEGKKRDKDIAYYFIDTRGNFWIGALDGIYVFDKDSTHFRLFLRSSSWTMMEGRKGELWFGTADGLGQYDPVTQEMIRYQSIEEDSYSLPGDEIYDIFEDSHDHIWVATTKGVAVMKAEIPGVDYLFHIPGLENTLVSSKITSLLEDHDGNLWIGTSEKGIDKFNLDSHCITHYHSGNTDGLVSNKIRVLELGKNGAIYCGLWAGVGFGKLIPEDMRFELYVYNSKNTYSDWYNDLEFDKHGNLYLGFWGGPGLTMFDTLNKRYGRILTPKFNHKDFSRLITCLHYDSQERMWMGTTQNGLHLYDPATDTSVSYLLKHNTQLGIDQKLIYDVAEDISGNIWIGARGLFLKKTGNDTIRQIMLKSYTIQPEVFAVLPENENTIWLLTNKGLLRYIDQFKSVVDYSAGIKLEFTVNAASALILKDNRLVFGGNNGIAIVDPDKLNPVAIRPLIFLSSLSVFDKIKFPDIGHMKEVNLKHNENFFSINIGSDTWGIDEPFNY